MLPARAGIREGGLDFLRGPVEVDRAIFVGQNRSQGRLSIVLRPG